MQLRFSPTDLLSLKMYLLSRWWRGYLHDSCVGGIVAFDKFFDVGVLVTEVAVLVAVDLLPF